MVIFEFLKLNFFKQGGEEIKKCYILFFSQYRTYNPIQKGQC